MDLFKAADHFMAMDDASWERHANPWSVYTRFSCLPLIALAIWSRVWLGGWVLLPLALALIWTWVNPRVFGKPDTLDNWASEGVMGERLFLNRAAVPIADHHVRMAHLLTWASAFGALILIWGLVILDPWATICGLVATIGPKVWFVDRMVSIYREAHNSS